MLSGLNLHDDQGTSMRRASQKRNLSQGHRMLTRAVIREFSRVVACGGVPVNEPLPSRLSKAAVLGCSAWQLLAFSHGRTAIIAYVYNL